MKFEFCQMFFWHIDNSYFANYLYLRGCKVIGPVA